LINAGLIYCRPLCVVAKELRTTPRDIFISAKSVPWYMDVLGNMLIDNGDRISGSQLVIKACKNYHFYDFYKEVSSRNRELLSEPFFHRITSPDNIGHAPREVLRGLADTLLFLACHLRDIRAKKVKKSEKWKKGDDLFAWFQLTLTVQNVAPTTNGCVLEILPEVLWKDSLIDYRTRSISIVSTQQREKPILMASPNFREAVGRLAEVWHDSAAKSAVLSAGSGSGKEELKEVLAYGLRLKHPPVPLSAPALAAEENPLHSIYVEIKKRGLTSVSADAKTDEKLLGRTLIFFDEIHQVGVERLRAQLLRVMECEELPRGDGNLLNCDGVFYLFAGSKLAKDMRTSCPPPDFWTRLEHTVEMRHPLELTERADRKEVLRQYFCLFWEMAASKRKAGAASIPARISRTLSSPDCVEELAKEFADSLASPLIPIISVRILRSIVGRLFSKATYNLRTTKLPPDQDNVD
ncbi:MAG: hypothetical protein ACREXR_15255, partial [Gammaproteobacteria bacterium]